MGGIVRGGRAASHNSAITQDRCSCPTSDRRSKQRVGRSAGLSPTATHVRKIREPTPLVVAAVHYLKRKPQDLSWVGAWLESFPSSVPTPPLGGMGCEGSQWSAASSANMVFLRPLLASRARHAGRITPAREGKVRRGRPDYVDNSALRRLGGGDARVFRSPEATLLHLLVVLAAHRAGKDRPS